MDVCGSKPTPPKADVVSRITYDKMRSRTEAAEAEVTTLRATLTQTKTEIYQLKEATRRIQAERDENGLGIGIVIQGWTTLTHQHCHIEITTHLGFTHQISINIPISNLDIRLQYQESWNDARLKITLLNTISAIIRRHAKPNSPAEYSTKIEAAVTKILLSAITNLTGSHPALTDGPRTRADRPMLSRPGTSTSITTIAAPPVAVSPPPASKPKAPPAKTTPPVIPMTAVPLHGLTTGLPRAIVAVDPPSPPGSPKPSSWDTLSVAAAARTETKLFSQVDQPPSP